MKHWSFALTVCMILAAGTLAPATARAAERSAPAEMGLGMASFLVTLPYGLTKTVYALTGTLTGGLAWVCTGGRHEIARAIIQPAVRGDYVVAPEHLLAQRALVFVGRDPLADSSGGF